VNVFLSIGVSAALCGCALPTATYTKIAEAETSLDKKIPADTFELATTQVQVKQTGLTKDEKPIYEVSVIRAGDAEAVYGVTANRKWYGVNTTLSITKVANTPLVDSISSEVEDKRVEFIKSAAKFVGTLIGIGDGPGGAAASTSKNIDKADIYKLQDSLDDLDKGKSENDLKDRKATNIPLANGLSIDIDAVPTDAIETSKLELDKMSRVFFYSACRPAKIKSTINGQDSFIKVAVADSRFVQFVAFPAKGKIQTHTQCGISVLPEKATVTPDIDVAQAALDEVLKLREELNKKSGSGGGSN
jgi:hypothetical protein